MLVKHTDFLETIGCNCHTIIQPGVDRRILMQHLISSDLLFLPLGFDRKTREYAFLSMLTKVTEYMISGTPILVNCPEDFAIYEYLQKYDAAFLCPFDDEHSLQVAIDSALHNSELKEKYSKNAYNLVMESHTIKKVRPKFKNVIQGCLYL